MTEGGLDRRLARAFGRFVLVVLGLLLALTGLEVGLRITGSTVRRTHHVPFLATPRAEGTYRILCLGESTTAGDASSYPAQLEAVLNERAGGLNERGVALRFAVVNGGVFGSNTARILSELERNLDTVQPDLVVAMMGVNDWVFFGETRAYDDPTWSAGDFVKSLRVWRLGRAIIGEAVGSEIGVSEHGVSEAGATGDADPAPYPLRALYRDLATSDADPDVALARCFTWQGRFGEAERRLKAVLERDADAVAAWQSLGWCYLHVQRFDEAQRALERAAMLDSKCHAAHIGLGLAYLWGGRREQARQSAMRAVVANPEHGWGYYGLGVLFTDDGAPELGAKLFDLAIEKSPDLRAAHHALAAYYRSRGETANARRTYERAIEAGIADDGIYGGLATLFSAAGDTEAAKRFRARADHDRLTRFRPGTRYNYLRLRQVLRRRGIRLVCMQYPMRNVAPLRRMLAPAGDVIFVDNEAAFERAVRQHGWDHVFTDHFAGDFGHCTRAGNRLMAENLAGAILRGLFDSSAVARN